MRNCILISFFIFIQFYLSKFLVKKTVLRTETKEAATKMAEMSTAISKQMLKETEKSKEKQ